MSRGGLVGLAGKEAERDSPDGVAAEQPQRLGASKALNLFGGASRNIGPATSLFAERESG